MKHLVVAAAVLASCAAIARIFSAYERRAHAAFKFGVVAYSIGIIMLCLCNYAQRDAEVSSFLYKTKL